MEKIRMIYFITGGSGSGKTTILKTLKHLVGNSYDVFDFDTIGVPMNANKQWRQEATEKWIEKLLTHEKESILLGQMVLGEIIASPSASLIGKIHFCLLDVTDKERIRRLKQRNTEKVDQHVLNWASWLRIHTEDPQWEQHVIKNDGWNGMLFSRWDKADKWNSLASIKIIDTTNIPIDQVAWHIKDWVFSFQH